MAQIQWLGDIDSRKNDQFQRVGEGISAGVGAFLSGQERGRERKAATASSAQRNALDEAELDVKRKQIEHDYAKLDYDKRKDAYDTMVKLLPNMPPDRQQALTSSPEWTALESSLGLPSIAGSTLSKEQPEPGWSSLQKTASVRENLIRRRIGPKRDMFGVSEPKDLTSEQDAIDYITEEGLDPSAFADELAAYKTAQQPAAKGVKSKQQSPYKEYPDAFLDKDGKWKVRRGGKTYRIEE